MATELVVGLGQMRLEDKDDKQNVFPLLDLPDVVVQKVLRYLNIWTLMDLRAVCKKMKEEWIEGSHLDKFVLCVKNHVHLEEILKEPSAESKGKSSKWSNVKIICDSEMHNERWIHNPLYSRLLEKLSDSLTILTLEEHRVPHSGLLSILSTCKVLKSLDIGTLDCKDVKLDEFRNEKTANESLANLEHLCIRYLAWNSLEDLELFEFILSKCTSLITLKAPHILMASLFSIGDTDDEDADRKYLELVEKRLTTPIIGYLRRRNQVRNASKSNMKYMDVESLHHSEVFPTLAAACLDTDVKLLNVSEAYETQVPESDVRLVEAIESLSGFTCFLDFSKLVNLKSIKLDTETSADSAVGNDWIRAELPHLKSISFCLPEDIDRSILNCLLKQVRTTVTYLSIEFEVSLTKLGDFFQASDVVNSFPNLTSISLIQWDGQDSDLLEILTGLPNLESVRLQRCLNITDKGLLGENLDVPIISSLKRLKKLWIDCNISNAVLTKAIKHIGLEELFFSSEQVTTPGFMSLTTGVIASTLVIFQGTQPNDCCEEVFEAALKKFKNLKRGPKYFEYYADSALSSSNFLGRR